MTGDLKVDGSRFGRSVLTSTGALALTAAGVCLARFESDVLPIQYEPGPQTHHGGGALAARTSRIEDGCSMIGALVPMSDEVTDSESSEIGGAMASAAVVDRSRSTRSGTAVSRRCDVTRR